MAREDPRALLPGSTRVLRQPVRDRRRRRPDHVALDQQPVQLSAREARQRPAQIARQLARDRLDLRHLLRGKRRERPDWGRSSRPLSRSLAKRLRRRPTTSASAVQPGRDLDVAQPVGRIEHQLGRCTTLCAACNTPPSLKLAALLDAPRRSKHDLGGAASHQLNGSRPHRPTLQQSDRTTTATTLPRRIYSSKGTPPARHQCRGSSRAKPGQWRGPRGRCRSGRGG